MLEFEDEGHQSIGMKSGFLRVKLVQVPHKNFKRTGSDLIYSYPISLNDALMSVPLEIVTLDG